MTEHTALTSTDVHEPKHITSSVTTDTGKVITPSSTTSGTSELRQLDYTEITNTPSPNNYGEMDIIQNTTGIVLSAGTSDLYATTNWQTVTGLFQAGVTDGITYASDLLTVPKDGIYILSGWASVQYSVNNVLVGIRSVINGTLTDSATKPIVRRKIGTGTDIGSVSMSEMMSLTAGDTVGIAVGCDTGGTLTISDASFALVLLEEV